MIAHTRAKQGSKSRLIGDCDPDEFDLPPKPKWMRWHTYNRHVERYDAYEDILDEGTFELMAKLLGRSSGTEVQVLLTEPKSSGIRKHGNRRAGGGAHARLAIACSRYPDWVFLKPACDRVSSGLSEGNANSG